MLLYLGMNAPENIVIARHAQSHSNWVRQGEILDVEDSRYTDEHEYAVGRKVGLTEQGEAQAVALGGLIRSLDVTFDAYFLSPSKRAIQTAKLMDLPDAEWQIERRIRERDYGVVETMSNERYEEEFPRNAVFRKSDPLYWRPPSGESLVEVVDRFGIFMRMLHEEYAGKNIMVLSHGDFMWAAMCSLESLLDDEWERRYGDEAQRIRNTHVFHYTRRNPDTEELDPIINWVRRQHPEDVEPAAWEPLHPITFRNQELG